MSDAMKKLQDALKGSRQTTQKPARPKTATTSIEIKGNNNIVAGRDVIHTERVVQQSTFTPGAEHVTEEQCFTLLRLMDEIVEIEAAVKKEPRDQKAVRGAFKARFKLASYRGLAASRYDEAVSYLRQTIGRLRSAKSAPKKVASQRMARYRAIHARVNEKSLSSWKTQYLVDHFGVASLTLLSDADLETTYRAVMGK